MRMTARAVSIPVAAALAVSVPLRAHHSIPPTFQDTYTDIQAVVTDVRMSIPHAWLMTEVKGEKGDPRIREGKGRNGQGLVRPQRASAGRLLGGALASSRGQESPERAPRTAPSGHPNWTRLRGSDVLGAGTLRALADCKGHLVALAHRVERCAGARGPMEEILGAVCCRNEAKAFVSDSLDGAAGRWHA